jgi:hypothetical protein
MNRLSVISTFLLVPPVGVRVTKLSCYWRRIDISAILRTGSARSSEAGYGKRTIPGSSASVFPLACQPPLQEISNLLQRRAHPLTNEGYSGPACATPRCCPNAARRAMGSVARSGRAVAIRLESICMGGQKEKLVMQARSGELYLLLVVTTVGMNRETGQAHLST